MKQRLLAQYYSERRGYIVVELLMALSIATKPVDIKQAQRHHEFKVGKPARNIWADKRAELARREQEKAEAKRRAIEAGHKKMAEISRKIEAHRKQKRTIAVEASFYTAYCPEGCTGRTATGIDVSNTQYSGGRRIIAVDPHIIPLGTTGTLTLANGMSFAVIAADTGGAIRGNKIDVLVASESEARQLGRQGAVLTID